MRVIRREMRDWKLTVREYVLDLSLDHETPKQASHRENNNRLPNNSNNADRRSDSAGTGFESMYNYNFTPPQLELKIGKEFSDTMRTQFEGGEISGKLRYFSIYILSQHGNAIGNSHFTVLLLIFQ